MRIKKIRQSLGAIGKVADSYTTDSNACYNAPYVNNLHTYSTDEIRIGTWVDGKTLYRKVFTGTTGTTGTTEVDNLDISSLISTKGYILSPANYKIPFNFYGSSNSYLACAITDTNKITIYNSTNFNSATYYLILEYTKN